MNLEDRIQAAFADQAKSEDFEPLIADVTHAAKAASASAAQARDRALDPTTPAAEVASTRREMEDAIITFDRLQVAVKKLHDRHRAVLHAEENARRKLAYDKVLQVRDALAKELAKLYPPVAAQLADLMARIAANDREVTAINARLPDGAQGILVAELIARGMLGWVNNGVQAPSIVAELRLPAFHPNVHAPYAWSADAPVQMLRIRA
jgi:hypothetical protein